MSWKSVTMAVLLLTASVLGASAVHAEDTPVAKAAHDKAVHSYEAAKERLKAAEQKLQAASAETKSAAQKAVEAAKRAVEAAGSEAEAKTSQARSAVERLVGATHEAHAEAHAATDKAVDTAVDKANTIKAGVEAAAVEAKAAAVEAKQEAEVAIEHAGDTVHRVQAVAHQVVSDAVGSTGKGTRLRMARRAAWRWLAGDIDKPEGLPPSVREELRRHAQRIARLQRIRVLANEKPDTVLVKRADALIERENKRHQTTLQTLLAGAHAKRMTTERMKAAAEDEPDPAEETVEEEEEQP